MQHGLFLCCMNIHISDKRNSEQQEPHLSRSAFEQSLSVKIKLIKFLKKNYIAMSAQHGWKIAIKDSLSVIVFYSPNIFDELENKFFEIGEQFKISIRFFKSK